MKRLYCSSLILFLFLLFSCESDAQKKTEPASTLPELVRTKERILNYFNSIITGKMILVGQQCGDNGLGDTYTAYFERLFKSTGKTPALLGSEYGYKANINYTDKNKRLIDQWKAGGLVTISWHADCPWVEGYNCRWNTITNKAVIDPMKLLKNAPESPERTIYRNELTAIGGALKQLKDAGVIVLWRPFHEMNGTWFWWGVNDLKNPSNKAAYEALWRDMYNTLTVDMNLDNLIWVYAASHSGAWTALPLAMYPGNDVVDVVGADIYSKSPEFADYEALKKLNKPVVICENGPSAEGYGIYNEMDVLNTFKGKAAYFLQWHSWSGAKVAIIDNLNYYEMMQSLDAITLDELGKK